ncbi:hypothetical protein A2W13_02675 [Candidatus Woesebacteria bacterium RBG_16_36_11]|uniref:Uncharacterized protein n=3 Tax=Candidatus Woeseibacteriota TaxID=1752722 RepID=A0A1F7X8H9_9BACT|nr:MAG: hypothetical protein A2Z67_05650 [Candidatus Woesebacteria bacterium RBG_13_36_22]OGM11069.1 MAG: hypothetical protein A2W13_02675 [Candidatus Woesebacteria bacterium RBG_16_36_11]OGM17130.1 MAG: hypothetical protein A2V55_00300 [Candidatus Woesebacteria bacterium RBG_19FT_COMBO_37_29]
MTEERCRTSVGEAGDIIATAQRLIEAGVLTGDNELIKAGKERLIEVWPTEIVNLHVNLYIEDLRNDLANSG